MVTAFLAGITAYFWVRAPSRPDAPTTSPSVSERKTFPTEHVGNSGPGTLFGSIKTFDASPLPENLVVELHMIPEDGFFDENPATVLAMAATIENGEYRFDELPLGAYAVSARSSRFAGNASRMLTRSTPSIEANLVLHPAATLSGTVVDSNGTPVSSARVYYMAEREDGSEIPQPSIRPLAAGVPVNDHGAFRIDNLSDDSRIKYRLRTVARGYAVATSRSLELGSTDVQMVLNTGTYISGKFVHFDTGEPVPQAKIALLSKITIPNSMQTTDDEGYFVFGNLHPGTYHFAIEKKALVPTRESRTVEVPEAGITGQIVYVGTGGTVAGRIYDSDTEKGLWGARIQALPVGIPLALPVYTSADSSGQYEFDGMLDGAYHLEYYEVKGYSDSRRAEDSKKVDSKISGHVDAIDFALSKASPDIGAAANF
jgi:hypothetical protein